MFSSPSVDLSQSYSPVMYHLVPPHMKGETLYPLETLKKHAPDLAAAAFSKYDERQALAIQRIPILDLLWTEVLFFLPVHPGKISAAARAAGFPERPPAKYFEIDVRTIKLCASKIAFYDLEYPSHDGFKINPQHIFAFTHEGLQLRSELRESEIAGYKRLVNNKCFVPFAVIPHVLVGQEINISAAKIIEA